VPFPGELATTTAAKCPKELRGQAAERVAHGRGVARSPR
jgi:hypothetical protein